MTRPLQLLKLAAGLVLAAAIIALIINVFTPAPSGPTGSSYATAPTGLSAYAELLARAGHPVRRLRVALARSNPPTGSTLIVLDPTRPTRSDVASLRRFVVAGGRLIAGGSDPDQWLSRLIADPPQWAAQGDQINRPLLPLEETGGAGQVLGTGGGSWSSPRASLPVLGGPTGALLTVARAGAGEIMLLADSTPLANELLAHADNAAFGLGLAGGAGRPVIFAESVHGYGTASGLAALPTRWKWALAGLLLAAATGVATRIRRLGPPEPGRAAAIPARRAHVDALAVALKRTRRPGPAVAPVREQARRLVRDRSRLGADAPEAALVSAAQQLGLDGDEARTLGSGELTRDEVLAAGRALAKLAGPRT